MQVFRAQVRKFRVRSFMTASTIESVGFGLGSGGCEGVVKMRDGDATNYFLGEFGTSGVP